METKQAQNGPSIILSPLFPAFSATPCSLNCRWKKACSQICTYSFLTKVMLLLSLAKLIQHSNCSTYICSGGTHSQEYKGQHQCIFSCFCSQEACFLDKWTEPEFFFSYLLPPPPRPPFFFWWFECLALFLCWVSCLVFFLVTGLLWACIFVHLHFHFFWKKFKLIFSRAIGSCKCRVYLGCIDNWGWSVYSRV